MTTHVFESETLYGLNIDSEGNLSCRHSVTCKPGYWKVFPPLSVMGFFGLLPADAVVDDYGSLVRVERARS